MLILSVIASLLKNSANYNVINTLTADDAINFDDELVETLGLEPDIAKS